LYFLVFNLLFLRGDSQEGGWGWVGGGGGGEIFTLNIISK